MKTDLYVQKARDEVKPKTSKAALEYYKYNENRRLQKLAEFGEKHFDNFLKGCAAASFTDESTILTLLHYATMNGVNAYLRKETPMLKTVYYEHHGYYFSRGKTPIEVAEYMFRFFDYHKERMYQEIAHILFINHHEYRKIV